MNAADYKPLAGVSNCKNWI